MPDTKITALAAIVTVDPAVDVLPIVDVSDTSMAASGTTKKITSNQLLGAGGTATLASATISGDLTVDTNVLKVDSTNDNVGIGTTTPASYAFNDPVKLAIANTGTAGAGNTFTIASGSTGFGNIAFANGTSGTARYNGYITYYHSSNFMAFHTNAGVERYRIGSDGTATWYVGGSTAMTLNSTGLAIGAASATRKLSIIGSGATYANIGSGDNTSLVGLLLGGTTTPSAGQIVYDNTANSLALFTLGTSRLLIDTSGQVGIGVTPYASWPATSRALQLGASASIEGRTNDGSRITVYSNTVFNGTNLIYQNTAVAAYYQQAVGVHSWHTSNNTPSAGNTATFTQAMTLTASGDLLVGTTDATQTSGVGTKILGSGLGPYVVNAATTNSALAYTMYSTGAAAYRFYVGWGGTVFATNTTISAISDARLKENVQDIDVGLGAILALKPRKFDWKAGKGKDIKGDRGFIAQEFEQVFPNLVDEWKDNAPEGEAPYKSVRQDLIPVLVKAIQELTARVQTLEAK